MKKVLLVGTGDVGKHILEFAARDEFYIEWIVGDAFGEFIIVQLTQKSGRNL